jgi:histidyl-tRNA synthetase
VFVVDVEDGRSALAITDELRRAGIGAASSFGGRSMKAQMKVADRSGALLAVLVGSDEIAAGEVTIRDLRGDRGQARVSRSALVHEIRKRLQ